MSKLIKDLGAVSAYAYAVEKGYTGTEDEFAELMYDYTDVAQTAVEAKDEAVSASTSAQANATIANTKAEEASASASKAQSASDSAQGAETNAETFALNAGTKATEAKQFADKAELNAQKTQSDKETVESAKSDVLSAVDNAQNYANSAQSASQAIQDMDVKATTLEPDSDATVEKTVDATSGVVTLTYGIPKGIKGEKGDKGNTGDSGVYIGTSAPSDENVKVWIDSDGEPDDVIQIDDTLTQSGQAADAKKTGDEITSLKEGLDENVANLKSALDDVEDIVYVTEDAFVWENILDQIVWEEGFVRLDGTSNSSSSYHKTQKIPVSSGDQFTFGGDSARFLTAYSGSAALSASGAEYATSYTVPDGVDGVIMSFTPVTKPTVLRIRHSKQVIKGNEIAKLDNDIQATNRKLNLKKSNNVIDPNNIDSGHFYNLKGELGTSSTYNCTNEPIPVNPTDVVRVYDGNKLEVARYITAYDASMNALQSVGVENSSSYTVPDYVAFVRISWSASFGNDVMITVNAEMLAYEPYFDQYYSATSDFLNGYYKNCKSANLLNPETLTDGMYIRQNGSSGSSGAYAVTDYIPVKQGDVINAFMGNNNTISFRYVTAYSASKRAIASLGAENVSTYTVPAGISYVRLSGNASYFKTDTCVITVHDLSGKYQPYKENDPYEFATDLYTATSNIYRFPLTSLPPYIIGLLSYRPLGSLSKGYVCLVSDDGDADVATYTIPMVISKDVPCTFAAMRSSTCWDNGSAQATVIDAVQNHGCEIAQHGGSSWLTYNEYTLNHFFDKEKEFWDSLGLTAYGAVCPQHDINNTIRAVAGGRFGALRTGYINQYGFYNNGARSNVLGLSSQSSLDGGLASQKSALDDAYQNNRLRMIHWHENEMSADDKATLEGLIDYAKTLGLTFITMKDIPNIA